MATRGRVRSTARPLAIGLAPGPLRLRRLFNPASPASRFSALALLALPALVACAGDLIRTPSSDGLRFRHRSHGYSILAPESLQPASAEGEASAWEWKRVEQAGTDLSFQSVGATMSLLSRCQGLGDAPLMILARHLLFGLEKRSFHQAGPTLVDGCEAWTQILETRQDGRVIQIKTVSARADRCVFDWILVTPDRFVPLEQSFDRWWGSWRAPAGTHRPAAEAPLLEASETTGKEQASSEETGLEARSEPPQEQSP